ncbi:family S53 protease-like protein [Dichomitus squalens LYAD-421 SS1]|uniref:family S53 protease-like protein n=1 Tax=Dichomitus squalens (strain LYAD-421) TaxID=732165 RepID=UPI0004414770|nr:family S53 protease-like protein [Dichomitus squalens LYAD-421 SS1]EJF64357.1 family S53 protease-like protein [Dichomitus squalens LYAD-421 SS1]
MIFAKALLTLTYLGLACATSSTNFVVHENIRIPPRGFTSVGPAPQGQTITLRIALAQANKNAIVDALYSVSDPTSAIYGQHLSKAEVNALVAPSSDTKNVVDSWLHANGFNVTTLSPAGDWISINVPVSKANALLGANFTTFAHRDSGRQFIRTLSYSLPESLRGHVDLVHPTVTFPDPASIAPVAAKMKRAIHEVVQRDVSSTCANGTIPACLQDLYKIPTAPATNKKNSLGVTGFFGNNAHYAFLETFLQQYRPDMNPATNFSVVGVDGGSNDQDVPSVSEGELDIQYTVGLATNVPVTYYFIGTENNDALGGYLDEANLLLGLDAPPLVLTTSYGQQESTISFELTERLCQVYAQLGARGTTILYASGDSGPGCPSGNNTNFQPTFPSNCPFVTSVGGTQGFAPEEAWTGSSGGFSNYYPRPPYQAAAVGTYLARHGHKNAGKYNASGRAFPDIAAKADEFIVSEDGPFPLFGTSASSPTMASIIALINDKLLNKGRPPLGFLNPWLYGGGFLAFTDITKGNSSARCSFTETVQGFDAEVGWDPVTGLGTPRFDKLVSLLGL